VLLSLNIWYFQTILTVSSLVFLSRLKALRNLNAFRNYLLTYLLTYSMEQNPSWEANRFSASQEIPRNLWNPMVHHRIHKSLTWASSIQSIPVHPTSWRYTLILSSHLRLGLPSGLFPSDFPTKRLYTSLLPLFALHAPPISFFSILSLEQY
jgi:hypothetical protein